MKKIFGFVLVMSAFMVMGCNPTVNPGDDNGTTVSPNNGEENNGTTVSPNNGEENNGNNGNNGNETPAWTYPVAREDILRMRVQVNGNKILLHIWKNDGNNNRFTEENNIGGYKFTTYTDDTFSVNAMYYRANPDNYHYPVITSNYNISEFEQFVNDIQNHPAVAAQYNLPVKEGMYTGHEDEVAELWDLLDLINDFYIARTGNPPPLSVE